MSQPRIVETAMNEQPLSIKKPAKLSELATIAHQIAQEKGWYEGYKEWTEHPPGKYATAWMDAEYHPTKKHDNTIPRPIDEHVVTMHAELGEAWGALRKQSPETLNNILYDEARPVGFLSELADVIITALDAAKYWNICIDTGWTAASYSHESTIESVQERGRDIIISSYFPARSTHPRDYVALFGMAHKHATGFGDWRFADSSSTTHHPIILERTKELAEEKAMIELGRMILVTASIASLTEAPLAEAVYEKLSYNATRSYQHGKNG